MTPVPAGSVATRICSLGVCVMILVPKANVPILAYSGSLVPISRYQREHRQKRCKTLSRNWCRGSRRDGMSRLSIVMRKQRIWGRCKIGTNLSIQFCDITKIRKMRYHVRFLKKSHTLDPFATAMYSINHQEPQTHVHVEFAYAFAQAVLYILGHTYIR